MIKFFKTHRIKKLLNKIKELFFQIFGILAFIKKHVELYVFLDKGKDAENLKKEFFYFI